jgi:hypothetical protein
MTRRGYAIVGTTVALAAAALLAGDYLGLFGTRTQSYLDYTNAAFQAVDADTGAVITSVFANCAIRGNRTACTQNAQAGSERVELRFSVMKQRRHGLIFDRQDKNGADSDFSVQIMFIHPDYQRKMATFKLSELFSGSKIHTVELYKMAIDKD